MKTLRILFGVIPLFLAQLASGAGVTIITHGFQPFAGFSPRPIWVDAMGNYIADIANRSGGNAAIYEMDLDGAFSVQVTSFTKTRGLPPSGDPNAEVIIKLYWNKIADSFSATHPDTTEIAQAVVPFLPV